VPPQLTNRHGTPRHSEKAVQRNRLATAEHVRVLRDLIVVSRVAGPKIHDTRIAAICLAHGVSQLWTADRDFSFFPSLRTHNPLVER